MALFGRIRPLYFFGAFALGILFCYVLSPAPRVVVKFPTPYNAETTLYRDKADTCYKYNAEQVSCPLDRSTIRVQPLAVEEVGAAPSAAAP